MCRYLSDAGVRCQSAVTRSLLSQSDSGLCRGHIVLGVIKHHTSELHIKLSSVLDITIYLD